MLTYADVCYIEEADEESQVLEEATLELRTLSKRMREEIGAQFTCFTGTKVQILTHNWYF
jgi:hypothetical protein